MFDLVVLGLGAKFPSVIYLVACIPYHTGKATSGSPSPLSLITEIAFSCIITPLKCVNEQCKGKKEKQTRDTSGRL